MKILVKMAISVIIVQGYFHQDEKYSWTNLTAIFSFSGDFSLWFIILY
jgi:hypothetical protein